MAKPFLLCSFLLSAGFLGCAADLNARYDAAISGGDYIASKNLMRQLIHEISFRDFNPTLPKRLGQAYLRMAFAHGKLGEYDSMKADLISSANHDGNFGPWAQKMLEHFEVVEFNRGADAYNGGDHAGSLRRFRVALSIIDSEKPHEQCMIVILKGMTSAAMASGDIREATEICRRASVLGDAEAKSLLANLENGNPPKLAERIEHKKDFGFTVP